MDVSIFEQKNAITLILNIADNPGCTKSYLVVGPNKCNDRTTLATLNKLIDYGLVNSAVSPRKHSLALELTPLGYMVAAYLRKIKNLPAPGDLD